MGHIAGSPLTKEEFDSMAQERTAEIVEAMQRPRDHVAEAAMSEQLRKQREFEWDARVLEFESEQEAVGTRLALSNFAFEIVTTIATVFMPGCYGLIVNDGSKNAEIMLKVIAERQEAAVAAEKAGISPNPVPRASKS